MRLFPRRYCTVSREFFDLRAVSGNFQIESFQFYRIRFTVNQSDKEIVCSRMSGCILEMFLGVKHFSFRIDFPDDMFQIVCRTPIFSFYSERKLVFYSTQRIAFQIEWVRYAERTAVRVDFPVRTDCLESDFSLPEKRRKVEHGTAAGAIFPEQFFAFQILGLGCDFIGIVFFAFRVPFDRVESQELQSV